MTDMNIENRKLNRPASENDKQHKKVFPIEAEAFHSPEQTLARLNSHRQGLTTEEAGERLKVYGRNEVAHEQVPPVLVQLLQAFNNPFIYVLMALAGVSFITDYWLPLRRGEETDLTGVLIILTMISLSGLLRFWQEFRTNKAAQALKKMVRTTATVLRRGPGNRGAVQEEIPIEELVPGDVVFLAAGDLVPADVRLLASRDLFISQSILSGESLPVEKYDVMADVAGKDSEQLADKNKSLLDMGNICLMGTNVTSGRAQAVVVATGSRTWFGSLAKSIVGTRTQTAFDRGVNSVSWLLIRFMLIMVPVVLLINGFSKGDWVEASLFALAVAVGLTPEMLPMIVSSNLAKGAIAMSRRKVIVKRLNAIQNFGAMDVLCTDKTGTLTQDNIFLEHHLDVSGVKSSRVLMLAWLNSSSQSGARNVMDRAILRFGEGRIAPSTKARFVKHDELPFDFVRRRVSVLVEDVQHGDKCLICKGAVEEMLTVATHLREGDRVVALTETRRELLLAKTEDYNAQGFRVLLIATRKLEGCEINPTLSTEDETALTIEGMLTFLDPPKESAGKAISALRDNGVAVKVLTGDNPVVTARICLEVGIDTHDILTGTQVEAMSDAELASEVEKRAVFARLTPLQKTRVLKALQKNGHTVGFLGDGINDAPALRDADVGISVDSAADIAKESSDIILLEKDLMVLEEGVIKGRETFGNIIKYLNMTASSNFGNVFSVLVASAFIPFLPMLAIHLLIQNLMYDISQLSLPWDKMDKEFLRKPRKWDAKNIGRFMLWIGPTSSIFDITTFALMWYVFAANNVEAQALFQSGWFIEGLLSQTLVVHMLRTQKIPFIQSRATLPVLLTTGLIMATGIYIPFSPLGAMVGLEPLPMSYFPWLVVTLLSYCLVAQGMKRFYIKRFGQWF
ncbi:magnesium-translocating P-type ATPase [Salmonella bongori]|uniref:magnesium-translocating P-type ATPase n=1 Tax=Salmonella bongori TaxID=54736 RepID=UPI0009AA45F9|nr:magnesium-translocating P-type ATPase [Salmonella bongori]